MTCDCDPHLEYCNVCYSPEQRYPAKPLVPGKPLPESIIMEMALSYDVDATWNNNFFDFIRAIERAHGVGNE